VIITYYVELFTVAEAQLYQWSCSPLDTAKNQYTLPNLPLADVEEVARTGESLLASDPRVVYIFPVPPVNCSGTVSAVRYCYSVRSDSISEEQFILTVLIMAQRDHTFAITYAIDVYSTMSTKLCTKRKFNNIWFCCDTSSIDEFTYPNSSHFVFGIVGRVHLLGYSGEHFPSYLVEHYRLAQAVPPSLAVGDTYTIANGITLQSNRALSLFQFIIGK